MNQTNAGAGPLHAIIEIDWENMSIPSLVIHSDREDFNSELQDVLKEKQVEDPPIHIHQEVFGRVKEFCMKGDSVFVVKLQPSPQQ